MKFGRICCHSFTSSEDGLTGVLLMVWALLFFLCNSGETNTIVFYDLKLKVTVVLARIYVWYYTIKAMPLTPIECRARFVRKHLRIITHMHAHTHARSARKRMSGRVLTVTERDAHRNGSFIIHYRQCEHAATN